MDDERPHLNDAEKTEGPEGQEGKIEASVVSRRRALFAGLSAAPAVLTLLSRSAFAQRTELSCTTALSLFAGASLRPGVNRPTQEEVNQACAALRDLKNTDPAAQAGDPPPNKGDALPLPYKGGDTLPLPYKGGDTLPLPYKSNAAPYKKTQ